MKPMNELANRLLTRFGISLVRNSTLNKFHNDRVSLIIIGEWMDNCEEINLRIQVAKSIAKGETSSQLQQDVIARYINQIAPEPSSYFVEVGASDGVSISNTLLLEKLHAWSGILAEPARRWHRSLSENRGCAIDLRCVWNESDLTVNFQEMEVGEFSSIATYISKANSDYSGAASTSYQVPTVTLMELLGDYEAPKRIGFLSIDTEGSEYEILRNFDFSAYDFNFIAVEHNYSETRTSINTLLQANGYSRILTSMSKWDDWYIPTELLERFSENHG